MEAKIMKTVPLPCDIEDVVYVLVAGLSMPVRRRVTDIHISAWGITVTAINERTGDSREFPTNEFGKTVFTDLSDATVALQAIHSGVIANHEAV